MDSEFSMVCFVPAVDMFQRSLQIDKLVCNLNKSFGKQLEDKTDERYRVKKVMDMVDVLTDFGQISTTMYGNRTQEPVVK